MGGLCQRQRQSCERAHRLVRQGGPIEDPKPWFYAALFSLATPEEAAKFLQGHWFTAACVSGEEQHETGRFAAGAIGAETKSKLERIRVALREIV